MVTLSENKPFLQSSVCIAMLVGLLQGITGWAANRYWSDNLAEQIPWLALFDAVLAGGLCLQLLLKRPLVVRDYLMACGTGLLFGASTWWSLQQMDTSADSNRHNGEGFFSLYLFLLLLAYVLIPYLQSWHNRREGRFVYHDLYRHSWDNFFIVCVGLLLTGIFWLLIVLWASLFDMLHIKFFSDIFYSKPFGWLVPFMVTGLGITIGITNDRVIGTLRNIALGICRFMMPLTALITLLFTFTLPFTGLQAIWDTNHASPILLVLVAANVFFLNGIFQDGEDTHYAKPLQLLTNASLCMLPFLVVLAAYSTWLRIDQHGLTPSRVYAVLITLVGACYSFSYPLNVFRRNPSWLLGIRSTNIYTGLLICGLIIVTHSPLFGPLTLSARNQYNRLLDGKVAADQFDYGTLKYKLGRPGEHYLQQIRTLKEHPQLVMIQDRLQLLDNTKNYYDWQAHLQNPDYKKSKLEVLGGGEVPDNFTEALSYNQCETTCYLMLSDINTDGQLDVIIFGAQESSYLHVYMLKEGHWVHSGRYEAIGRHGCCNVDELKQLFTEHGVTLEIPAYRDLRLGDKRWNYTPE